ncbi:hypothetical protein V6N11_024487 [Hibiscus sabdariffa]|uniref:Uncharacterized protein n=1 Tax=Hibiscus sabdariffa TaxID=183260 RepID=A0ABR2QMD4_9ROSI
MKALLESLLDQSSTSNGILGLSPTDGVICELAKWAEEESTTTTLIAATTPKIKLEKEAMSAENVFDEMLVRDDEVKELTMSYVVETLLANGSDNPPPKVIVPSPIIDIFYPGIFLDNAMILSEWKFPEVALLKNSEHMAANIGNKKDISQRVKIRSHHFRFLGGIGHEVGLLWQISQQLKCGLVAERTFKNLNFSTYAYQANQILKHSDPYVVFVLFYWLKIKVGFKHDNILGPIEQFGLINRLLDQVLKDKCYSTVVICNCLIHSYGGINYLNNQSPKQQRKGNKDSFDIILKMLRRCVNVLVHTDMASRVIDNHEDSFSHHGKRGEVLRMKLDIQSIL